jgi:hypothetical protein
MRRASGIVRASTNEEKQHVVDVLLQVWRRIPEQRLGQLIDNAAAMRGGVPTFYIEDGTLVAALYELLEFVEKNRPR